MNIYRFLRLYLVAADRSEVVQADLKRREINKCILRTDNYLTFTIFFEYEKHVDYG